MWASVQSAFIRFSEQLEGTTLWMYLDVKGLLTTGIGVLIDSPEAALKLKWYRDDGTTANPNDVVDEWRTVKALVAHDRGPTIFWQNRARLKLRKDEMEETVMRRLAQFESYLRLKPQFKDYVNWPADAQLAVLSMAWAMGPDRLSSEFPKFIAALKIGDFVTAALESKMDETNNAGLVPRNKDNYRLLMNAASVTRLGLDVTVLQYPKSIVGAT